MFVVSDRLRFGPLVIERGVRVSQTAVVAAEKSARLAVKQRLIVLQNPGL
jgi:hypothetical protein